MDGGFFYPALPNQHAKSCVQAGSVTDVIPQIFCPLGISGHVDHLAVRSVAIDYWRLTCNMRPVICFYEDLPYAAKVKEIEIEVNRCIREISTFQNQLSVFYRPLSTDQLKKKIDFSRLYFTQNDQSELLKKHAEAIGKKCGQAYAERYICYMSAP